MPEKVKTYTKAGRMIQMIYLDSAATTPIDPEVLKEMMPYLMDEFGNAGSRYGLGRRAKGAVQVARSRVAELIHSRTEQIIFTSGGSEANSLAFSGMADHLQAIGKTHILVSAVEHDSVMRAAEWCIKHGFDVEYIPVTSGGNVSVSFIERAIRDDTGMVSVMGTNNETGVELPIEDIGGLCSKCGVLFHTDCVQALGGRKIDVQKIKCDMMSMSAHKIHGPKGVGALFVKNPDMISPLIHGGSEQEQGKRGGTENVAGIVGFGKACGLASARMRQDSIEISTLKQAFYTELASSLKEFGIGDCLHVNGAPVVAHGKILNLRFDGIDAETLMLMLAYYDICVSAGSACRSHESEPSHVLTAMGLTADEARSSLRISFSRSTCLDEVNEAADKIADCVRALKSKCWSDNDGTEVPEG